MKLIKFSTLLVICLCLTGIVNGQETTGVIEGTVVDAQGARVPGATVLVEGNAFSRTVTTDAEGFYRILQVPAGKYSITTSAPNFASERSENVTNVPYSEAAIRRAIARVWNRGRPRRFRGRNVYGGPGTGLRIASILANLNLDARLRRKLITY